MGGRTRTRAEQQQQQSSSSYLERPGATGVPCSHFVAPGQLAPAWLSTLTKRHCICTSITSIEMRYHRASPGMRTSKPAGSFCERQEGAKELSTVPTPHVAPPQRPVAAPLGQPLLKCACVVGGLYIRLGLMYSGRATAAGGGGGGKEAGGLGARALRWKHRIREWGQGKRAWHLHQTPGNRV